MTSEHRSDEPDTDGAPSLPTCVTAEDAEILRAALRVASAAYRRAFEQFVPAMIGALRQLTAAAESVRDEYTLAPPPPGRRRDRPAWQSPYGPPARRRR